MRNFYKNIVLVVGVLFSVNMIQGCSDDDAESLPIEKSDFYYIDSENGNDQNNGSSPEKAWKSFKNLKQLTVEPGVTINLKNGSVWNEVFEFKGSGDETNPIIVTNYGQGSLPKIAANGKPYAFLIRNQEYIEVSNLEITNKGDTPEKDRKGIYVEAKDFGAVHHLHFKNIEIHDVNGLHGGLPEGSFDNNKNSGGIVSIILGNSVAIRVIEGVEQFSTTITQTASRKGRER